MYTRNKYKNLVLFWSNNALAIAVFLFSPVAYADQFDGLLSNLNKGGYVIYIRHAQTQHDIQDDDNLVLSDCSSQRNLSVEGRTFSLRLNKLFKQQDIPVSEVISSPFCRALDTANLIFDRVEPKGFLHFSAGLAQSKRQSSKLRLEKYLNTPPVPGSNNFVIGHTSNLLEAVGIWPKFEGSMHIFLPQFGASPLYVGVVEPQVINDWLLK
jgi:phosphohistidine phosphatase SixA